MKLIMNEAKALVFQPLFPKAINKKSQLLEHMDNVSSWTMRCFVSKCERENQGGVYSLNTTKYNTIITLSEIRPFASSPLPVSDSAFGLLSKLVSLLCGV